MTAYCFVGSPGFSNCTSILGALPVGTASAGFTYSPAVPCERTITAVIPINTSAQPSRFILLIALPSLVRDSSQVAFSFRLQLAVSFRSSEIRLPAPHILGAGSFSRRRRHEFGTDWTSDRLPQILSDPGGRARAELPVWGARHSFQFLRMARAPQRRSDSGLV